MRIFVVVPIIHLMLLSTLIVLSNWYFAIVLGILAYYVIYQHGQSIGYHKMFSHRAFEPVSWFPYVSTFCGVISFIGCPVSYSVVHRLHHRYSDTDKDPHNPQHGMFHAYVGWILTYKIPTNGPTVVADILNKYRWLHNVWKYELLFIVLFYTMLFMFSKFLFCVIAIGSLLSLHTGFAINAFSHKDGEAIDIPFVAKWIAPVYMHKAHHSYARTYDYSAGDINDFSVTYIERFLVKH